MSRISSPVEASAGSTQSVQVTPRRLPHAGRRWLPLALLLLATLALRVGAIDRPLVGHFATKNAVYAMIARNWARGEASFWRPTIDVLKHGRKSWHLLEVPLSAYAAGALWHAFGGSLAVWGRGVSVACSLVSVALMFALVRRWHDETAAWGASIALALSPVSVIYGQMFMLEASVVMLTLLVLWSIEVFLLDRRWWGFVVAALSFSALTLTKIYMLALVAVAAAQIIVAIRRGARGARAAGLLAALTLAAGPAVWWAQDVLRLTGSADPASTRIFYSLGDSADTHFHSHSLLTAGAFYRRLMDDLAGVALTPIGLGLVLVAFTQPAWRRHLPWLAATGLLVVIMPRKFYEMSYYHLVTLPVFCVLVGLGWQALRTRLELACRSMAGVLLAALVFSLRYSYTPAFTIPAEDRYVVAAGEAVQASLPTDEPIATLHGSTLDLLYYCDRPGWALDIGDRDFSRQLAGVRNQGAKRLAVTGLDQLDRYPAAKGALAQLTIAVDEPGYRIYEFTTSAREGTCVTGFAGAFSSFSLFPGSAWGPSPSPRLAGAMSRGAGRASPLLWKISRNYGVVREIP